MMVKDFDDVLENEGRSYAYPWERGIFADCLAASHECWIVTHFDENVGHGILSVVAGEGHLLNVCIRRDRQGRGYGRELVLYMIERARKREADVIFLEVRPSNHVALTLYDTLGFNEIGTRENYYRADGGHEDASVLALQLNLNVFNG
ncbi:MAG: ribosomal protein S18-alanine N-acetyltransferase [Gammaproteobacteria bacterium]|nr:ribosomal protein S18-alanine N-acetyltransferase [Gammaproteobacteria bacterium]